MCADYAKSSFAPERTRTGSPFVLLSPVSPFDRLGVLSPSSSRSMVTPVDLESDSEDSDYYYVVLDPSNPGVSSTQCV